MTRTFASYTHSRIGFPHVCLKWHEENGQYLEPYITIHGRITQPHSWRNPHPEPFIEAELREFDEWVANRFSDDITVQG